MSSPFIIKRIILPVTVIALATGLAQYMISNTKKPSKKTKLERFQMAQIQAIPTQDYRIKIKSQGSVQARHQTLLIPEVTGRITWISEDFRNGKFFTEDEVLIKIDPRNYEIALSEAKSAQTQALLTYESMKSKTASTQAAFKTAQSNLAQNELELSQELQRADQALRDWERIAKDKEPNGLVLRKPQVKAAQAKVEAAKAEITNKKANLKLLAIEIEAARVAHEASKDQVKRRKIDLERTQIKAPYAGRVLSRSVELGQNVNSNTQLGQIFATRSVEIRLPINELESTMLLAARNTGSTSLQRTPSSPVKIISKTAHITDTWSAQLVRTEGSIDTQSRQKFVVAKVKAPFAQADKHFPLELGKFVNAELFGKTLKDVQVIPRIAIKSGQIIVLNSGLKAEKKKVETLWEDGDNIIIKKVLNSDEVLCLNSISTEGRFTLRLRPVSPLAKLPAAFQEQVKKQRAAKTTKMKAPKKDAK